MKSTHLISSIFSEKHTTKKDSWMALAGESGPRGCTRSMDCLWSARPSAGLNGPWLSGKYSWIDGGGGRCRGGNAQGLSKGAVCWYLIGPQGASVPDGMEASRSRHGQGHSASRRILNKKAGQLKPPCREANRFKKGSIP